jgi:hypothetical protein
MRDGNPQLQTLREFHAATILRITPRDQRIGRVHTEEEMAERA